MKKVLSIMTFFAIMDEYEIKGRRLGYGSLVKRLRR